MSAASALLLKTRFALVNTGRIYREQSRFKIAFLAVFGIVFLGGLWVAFLDGFRFLDSLGGASVLIINRLFSLFFLGLGAMLVVSSAVTSYSAFFRSEETEFMLARPFSVSEVVLYQFAQSCGLSSWAFFLVIIPFVGAYGTHQHLSPLFAVWTLLFSVPFLVVCCAVGAVVALVAVRWIPPRRYLIGLGFTVAISAVAALVYAVSRTQELTEETTFVLSRMVPGFTLAANPLQPGWWTAEGILALSRGEWLRGARLGAVLVSHALLALLIVEAVGRWTFVRAWQRATADSGARRRADVLLPGLDRALGFLGPDIRAVILKDIRTFLRDAGQWAQALVFFGLLALYFLNLRTFRYHALPPVWRNLIEFLNVFSVSAVLCSLSSRFLYPQLSLEGQGFWLIGLSPTPMRRVLAAKFMLALVAMLAVSLPLMAVSSAMLHASVLSTAVAIALATSISLAAGGLSVGLGAIFMDLSRRNPAAIVSGFGGTLNLAMSLAFMVAAILPFAASFHLYYAAHIGSADMRIGVAASAVWLVLLTAAATGIPLALGIRSLGRREF